MCMRMNERGKKIIIGDELCEPKMHSEITRVKIKKKKKRISLATKLELYSAVAIERNDSSLIN